MLLILSINSFFCSGHHLGGLYTFFLPLLAINSSTGTEIGQNIPNPHISSNILSWEISSWGASVGHVVHELHHNPATVPLLKCLKTKHGIVHLFSFQTLRFLVLLPLITEYWLFLIEFKSERIDLPSFSGHVCCFHEH